MQRHSTIIASLALAMAMLIESATVAAEPARVDPNDVLYYPVVRKNLDKENILRMLGSQEELAYVGAFAAASQGVQGAKILADYCAKEPVNLSAIFEGIARARNNASATLPTVVKYLGHEKKKIREGAIRAITTIRSPCAEAIEPLKKLAASADDIVERINAIGALGIAAHGHADVAAWLMKMFNQKPEIDLACIRALGSIGPAAKESVPTLIEFVASKKHLDSAVDALGEIGIDARAAVPVLLPLLKDEFLTIDVCSALRRIGDTSPELIAAVTAALGNKSSDIQLKALKELVALGPSAKQAVPQIKPLLNHEDPEVLVYAVIAWNKIEGVNDQQIKAVCGVIEIAIKNEKLDVPNNLSPIFPAIVFLGANSESAISSQEVLAKILANSEMGTWNVFASYAAMTLLKLNDLQETSKTALRDYSVMEHTEPALRMRIQRFLDAE